MTRYDIYDQQLNPGDCICCSRGGQLLAGTIHSISTAGTIRIHPWHPEKKRYSALTVTIKTYKIIKIAELPAQ